MYVYIHTYIHTYIHSYSNIYIYPSVDLSLSLSLCVYVCMYVYIYIYLRKPFLHGVEEEEGHLPEPLNLAGADGSAVADDLTWAEGF